MRIHTKISMSDVAWSASTIGKELLRIPIGTWERNCLTPPGCGRFNGATEYALSRGIQSQIDRCIYIGSSSGELSSTELRPEYLKPRLAKPLEIFVADDQMFEQRFDSCVAGILEDAFEGRFNPRNRNDSDQRSDLPRVKCFAGDGRNRSGLWYS